uniref:Uncharacterized protein n=1 Tax=Rhizophagus irregularis (strain DAOM 181602 / DAOM 197198 / MUCL 43194) TaxID=747089 RepID=U9UVB7_RHIID
MINFEDLQLSSCFSKVPGHISPKVQTWTLFEKFRWLVNDQSFGIKSNLFLPSIIQGHSDQKLRTIMEIVPGKKDGSSSETHTRPTEHDRKSSILIESRSKQLADKPCNIQDNQ